MQLDQALGLPAPLLPPWFGGECGGGGFMTELSDLTGHFQP